MNSYILITGGAGFIGTNLAHAYLKQGHSVMIYDSLARAGVEKNLSWLRQQHGERLLVKIADIRDTLQLQTAVARAAAVFHFAAQVAVTTSLYDPMYDFTINAQGTLNVLEALRQHNAEAPLVFTSTNKVYGELADLTLTQQSQRYHPSGLAGRATGIDETRSLDFHSPYGCSKGTADQYVLDYARIFGLRTVVFRMSCIYGPHQFGTEDQGWVAHFLIRALQNQPITIYGDGKQVRDLLFVDDLIRAFQLAHTQIDTIAGQAFNMGGGTDNSVSLLQVLQLLQQIHEQPLITQFAEWRPVDQRYYVSDTAKFSTATKWQPRVTVSEGLQQLYAWLCANNSPQLAAKKALPNEVPVATYSDATPHKTTPAQKSELVYGD